LAHDEAQVIGPTLVGFSPLFIRYITCAPTALYGTASYFRNLNSFIV